MLRAVVMTIYCLSAAGGSLPATGSGQIATMPGMFPGIDFNSQGLVCNNRYCAYRRYGLRWAMNTTGESIIWQHQDTRFIKIGYITLNEHLKQKNAAAAAWGTVKSKANPLSLARGYYFKYCDAVSHTCEYLGDRQYYTVSTLERLFVPVLEVRQSFPVDQAGKLVERRNRIVLTALGVAAGFFVSKLTISGVIHGLSKGVWTTLKAIFDQGLKPKEIAKAWRDLVGAPLDGKFKVLESIDHALPRAIGYVMMGIAGWNHIKAWGWFSSESYIANYYAGNVKMPLFMSVPDMFVANRKEKVSIETLRDAFDMALKGEMGTFVSTYKESQAGKAAELDEGSDDQ